MEESFRKYDILCTTSSGCLDIDIDMDYIRTFIAGSNSVSVPRFSHTVLIKDQGKVLVTQNVTSKTLGRSFSRNLKIIASVGSDDVNREDEVADINKVLSYIVKDIRSLSN